jgi:hypothetical protein
MPNITFRRNSVISATYLLRTKTLGNTFKLRAPSWLLPFAPKKSAAWELTELNRVFSQQFLWNQIKPQTIWFSGWVSTQKTKRNFALVLWYFPSQTVSTSGQLCVVHGYTPLKSSQAAEEVVPVSNVCSWSVKSWWQTRYLWTLPPEKSRVAFELCPVPMNGLRGIETELAKYQQKETKVRRNVNQQYLHSSQILQTCDDHNTDGTPCPVKEILAFAASIFGSPLLLHFTNITSGSCQ